MRLYVDILRLLPGSDLKGKRGTKSPAAPFSSPEGTWTAGQQSFYTSMCKMEPPSWRSQNYGSSSGLPLISSLEGKYYLAYFTSILFMPQGFLSHKADLILIYFFTITVVVGMVRIAVTPAYAPKSSCHVPENILGTSYTSFHTCNNLVRWAF